MSIQPRPYQAIDAGVARARKRVMLTHEPGLGKTLIATLILADIRPVLVSCPSYLVEQWRDHIRSEFPGAVINVAAGQTPANKKRLLAGPADFFIITHQMFRDPLPSVKKKAEEAGRRVREPYKIPRVPAIIFDESHHLRGRKSQMWRGARQASDRAEYVIELTATPVWREADDLYAQFRLLDRDLSSYWRFVEEYCLTKEDHFGIRVVGAHESMKQLMADYTIGRKYSEVGVEIPNVIPKFVPVIPTPETIAAYQEAKENFKRDGIYLTSPGSTISALRGIIAADEEKERTVVDLCNDLKTFVVFTWYRDTAARLGELLGATCITGALQAKGRVEVAKGADKIVATMASLSEGVDLSHHRYVIFYEEDYVAGRMTQVIKRLERWRKDGDDAPVIAYYIHARETLDEKIHKIWQTRAVTAKELLMYEFEEETE